MRRTQDGVGIVLLAAMAAGTCPFTIPSWVRPGTYELRLLTNDGYTWLATSNPVTVQ